LPLDPAIDQPYSLQHLQVPRDRRRADGEHCRDIADTELARGEQLLDDGAPRQIGERREHAVELRRPRGRHGTAPII